MSVLKKKHSKQACVCWLTDVALLEFARQVSLDEGGLACLCIVNKSQMSV